MITAERQRKKGAVPKFARNTSFEFRLGWQQRPDSLRKNPLLKGWFSLAHKHNISITSENTRNISISISRNIRRTNPLRAGSHFDISISISINISITKICVNRDYISISVRMAIAPAQFTSRESKIQ